MTDVPGLPVVWRPHTTRVIGYALAATIVLGMIVLAVVMPEGWGIADRVGLVVFGGVVSWVIHMLARCRVVADERGLTLVNAFRTTRYEWAEVVRINFARGEPWPTLDLASGDAIGAMGINGAEHARAAAQLAELRALLAVRGEGTEPSA
ncbi:MAG TPA: PH domain-containing protein [Streptosporangiaceae bacterium]|nr:PH domain-containing protein [Streptosporangiaceae bacterium]